MTTPLVTTPLVTTPLVTTIVPTFRRAAVVGNAVRSALAQTMGRLEVHVRDNASGDGTRGVVEALAREDPRVRYHENPTNLGMIGNHNAALSDVRTPYFSFLHDDDLLLPGFYEAALAALEAEPRAMFAACVTLRTDERGRVFRSSLRKWHDGTYEPPAGLRQVLEQGMPHWTGIVFRSRVVEEVGLIDERVGYYNDQDYVYRITARFPICAVKVPGSVFRVHGGNYESFSVGATDPASIRRMRANIEEDPRIPAATKSEFRVLLTTRHRKQLTQGALLQVSRGRADFAALCAGALDALDCPARATALRGLGRAASVPGVPAVLAGAVRTARAAQRLRAWAGRPGAPPAEAGS